MSWPETSQSKRVERTSLILHATLPSAFIIGFGIECFWMVFFLQKVRLRRRKQQNLVNSASHIIILHYNIQLHSLKNQQLETETHKVKLHNITDLSATCRQQTEYGFVCSKSVIWSLMSPTNPLLLDQLRICLQHFDVILRTTSRWRPMTCYCGPRRKNMW